MYVCLDFGAPSIFTNWCYQLVNYLTLMARHDYYPLRILRLWLMTTSYTTIQDSLLLTCFVRVCYYIIRFATLVSSVVANLRILIGYVVCILEVVMSIVAVLYNVILLVITYITVLVNAYRSYSVAIDSGLQVSGGGGTPNDPNPEPDNDDDNEEAGALDRPLKLPYNSLGEMMAEAHSSNDPSKNNRVTVAKRFAASGQEPTADIINEVQSRKGRNRITPAQVAILKKAYSENIVSLTVPLGKVGADIIRAIDPINNKTPGCYIMTHNTAGEQAVGSTIDLLVRVKKHLSDATSTTIVARNRVSQYMREHGRDNFQVQVVRLPLSMPQTVSAVLAFEQYLFLLLNPSINFFFIAGSTQLSPEQLRLQQEKNGTPLYIYYKGVLVYVTKTVIEGSNIMGKDPADLRNDTFVGTTLTDFKVTYQPVDGSEVNIMDIESLKELVAKYRLNLRIIYLYDDGYLISTFNSMNELLKATGFTKQQVQHSFTDRGGIYTKSTIMFSRTIIEGAPVRNIPDLRAHCEAARKVANQYVEVYKYVNNVLVDKYPSINKAYMANKDILHIRSSALSKKITQQGKYVQGEYTFSMGPLPDKS